MTPKEKFNSIVSEIERLAKGIIDENGYIFLKAHEISDRAFKEGKCYIDDRSKNVLFQFLVGSTVIDYVNERKMMATYEYLISVDKKEKGKYKVALEMSGVENQSSFIKKFNKQFGMSPKVALEKRDESLLSPMIDWETISNEGKEVFTEYSEEEPMKETKYGISKDKLIRAQVAENLQAFYKLNDLEGEVAFELSDKYDFDMEDTFEYVYNYVWRYVEDRVREKDFESKRDRRIREDLLNEDVIFLYFLRGMRFDDIHKLLMIKYYKDLMPELKQCSREYIYNYLSFVDYRLGENWNEQLAFMLGESYFVDVCKRSRDKNIEIEMRDEKKYEYCKNCKTGKQMQWQEKCDFVENGECPWNGYLKANWDVEDIEDFYGKGEAFCFINSEEMFDTGYIDLVDHYDESEEEYYDGEYYQEYNEYNDGYRDPLEEFQYDEEPDFDDPEWQEHNFLSYDYDDEHMYYEEEEDEMGEFDMMFEKLCDCLEKENFFDHYKYQRRLHEFYDLDVEGYIKEVCHFTKGN